ncbi:YhdP family protein [Salinarimonas soli]|uniref:YhdP central domain-containing protein n=1 Tax=Salinarimonas soli TaxID=1638099 RepID=A0A5B2V996_9HYPH|nr:DUF3971 domain-containing protein [Salinarimonas soli]KAA2235278.1 hypothetical protein F0L46_19870 [Salinarimonas soli]
MLRGALVVKLVLLSVALLAGLAFVIRLGTGPVQFAGLSERLADGLASRLGPGWDVSIDETSLALLDRSLALRASGVEIRNADGLVVARAPAAIVSVDTWSALRGAPQPRFVEFRDVQLKARVAKDGSFTLLPQGEAAAPPPQPPPAIADPAVASLPEALASGTGALLQPSGIVGSLDRARIVNSRLTLVDERGVERVGFERVDADFERDGGGTRLDAVLRSPGGSWSLTADARAGEGGGRTGVVTVRDVPVDDVLLLGGLAHLKGASNLKVSGDAQLGIAGDGALQRLDVRLSTGPGRLTLPNRGGEMTIDSASASASWKPERGVFAIDEVAYRAGETRIGLSGELAEDPGRGWRLALQGRDARLSGAGPRDRPVAVEAIDLAARGAGGAVVVERLEVRGPDVQATATVSAGGPEDRGGVRVGVRAGRSDARSLLRLWPPMIAPTARRFLAEAVRRGRIANLSIDGALTGTDITEILADKGMSDEALALTFAAEGVEFAVREGLPPLVNAALSGRVTGRTLQVTAPQARLAAADGRALGFLDGRFTVADIWPDATVGRLAFRLEGDADALVSVLNAPALRGNAGPVMDPAAVKGRAELRLDLALPVYDAPAFADLALTANGRITDLSIERVLGKERLENAGLSVAYDSGALLLKGEGRIAGTPAAIEVRQPKGGAGEAVIALVLDEAARARRGLAFGPQLTGPLPVRIVAPLAKGPRGGAPRVEVDLTKAAIEDLVPGWSKPAGRPGRLTFAWSETAPEIRDIQLDAGPVQIRGTAATGPDGALDKADLTTFRLSPGDDVKLQLERAANVHKVTVRGNVADMRPFLRYMRDPAPAPPARGAPAPAPAKEGGNVDLDVQVNILTGHNDEALTRAVLKASVRGRELREAEFNGRFTGAAVAGRTARQNGAPIFVLQTEDAGATLRFLDVYRRMMGGDGQFQIGLTGLRQPGTIRMRNFVLRNEPALSRIFSQQPPAAGSDAAAAGPPAGLNASEVAFTRGRAEFVRTGSRIDFRDAVISGAQVGFTLAGWLDQGRDVMDVSGTFVPAYGLNNAFAQVPLLGTILGGGSNEGLFAVNFRVAGRTGAPNLTVNPLSAIAPGIFRKLFGAGSNDANGPLPPLPER